MPLTAQAQQWYQARVAAGVRPLYTRSLAEARAADLAEIQASGGEPEPVHQVCELAVPAVQARSGQPIPLRLYRPTDQSGLPVLVYFFGGGWVLGQIETCDAVCRRLANLAGCACLAVGYRLAPEHRFPAAVEDCADALVWLTANATDHGLDPNRIAVGGDSAGGNLAAVTAQAAPAGSLAAQLLVYPNTQYRADTASLQAIDDEALFNRRSVDWYWSHYLNSPADGADPRVSPLLAAELTGLPPALVITAEYDPLRDEGERYADRLAGAGVPVECRRYDGVPHGFFTMSGVLDESGQALAQAAGFLRRSFAR